MGIIEQTVSDWCVLAPGMAAVWKASWTSFLVMLFTPSACALAIQRVASHGPLPLGSREGDVRGSMLLLQLHAHDHAQSNASRTVTCNQQVDNAYCTPGVFTESTRKESWAECLTWCQTTHAEAGCCEMSGIYCRWYAGDWMTTGSLTGFRAAICSVVEPADPTATGDPHMMNIHGQRFDLMQAGWHTLLHILRGARAPETLLRIVAEARRLSDGCSDIYFEGINITGAWAETAQTGGLRFDAQVAQDEKPPWAKFGPVQLKVAHGRTETGAPYLNFYVKHLGHLGFAVGGLLGEDDHTEAATPTGACRETLSLGKVGQHGQRATASASSVAEANLM